MTTKTQKFILGFMTLVILATSAYILLPENVKITVGNTYTTFQVYENNSWVTSGQEYSLLYNGTKNLIAESRSIKTTIDGNMTTIIRTSNFSGGAQVVDTYIFNGSTNDVEMYPISHNINVINGKGKILVYEVTKLGYSGGTVNDIKSPAVFLHKTKVSWDDGYYYSKLLKLTDKNEGKLTVKYKIDSDNYSKNVRLFDPILINKKASKSITVDTPDFFKGDFNSKYGAISIAEEGNKKIAEYSLTKVENSIIDAYAEGKAILYSKGKLFDDINFKNLEGLDENVKYKFYILKNISYVEQEVASYKQVCEDIESNSTNESLTKPTQNCYDAPDTYKNVTKYKNEWVEYNYEKLDAGNYTWKLEAQRPVNKKIDFIPSAFGKELNEWAWWNDSWIKKQQVNFTANMGNISYFNITYDTDMKSDFSDLRFTNSAENIELNYTIERYTASTNATIRVNNLGASSIWMYYGNPSASSKSNASATYLSAVSYFYLDEKSGTTTYDAIGTNNATSNATINIPGKIETAYNFTNGVATLSSMTGLSATQGSATFWVYPYAFATDNGFFDTYPSNGGAIRVYEGSSTALNWETGGSTVCSYTHGWSTNTWHYITLNWYSNKNTELFVDGVNRGNCSNSYAPALNSFKIGTTNGHSANARIDEFGIYNRPLTQAEISALYNSTTPTVIFGTEQNIEGISITLNSPTNSSKLNNSNVLFNVTISPTSVDLKNATLTLNGVNYTNTISGTSNITTTWTKTLSDGNYTWNVTACGNGTITGTTICNPSSTYTFSIDTTPPTFNISYPTPIVSYGYLNQTLQLNFSATDVNLDKVWYNYNGTNITVTGATSGVYNLSNITLTTKKNITFYANDTLGNFNSTTISWDYAIFENNRSYNTTTIEGKNETFIFNLTTLGALDYKYLNYDGVDYPLSVNGSLYYTTIPIPLVSSNSNKTFYFRGKYNGYDNITTYPSNISVSNWLVNWTGTKQYITINIRDEKNNSLLNSTILPTIKYYLDNYNLYQLFTNQITGTGTYNVYSNLNLNNINLDGKFYYSATGYYPRNRYIENVSYSNTSVTSYDYYLLNYNDGILARYIIYDNSGNPLSNVKIIAEKIVGSNNTLVEEEYTGTDGRASLFLDPTYSHLITISKSGCSAVQETRQITSSDESIKTLTCGTTTNATAEKTDVFKYLKVKFYPESFDKILTTNDTINVSFYANETNCNLTSQEFYIYYNNTLIFDETATAFSNCSNNITINNINLSSYGGSILLKGYVAVGGNFISFFKTINIYPITSGNAPQGVGLGDLIYNFFNKDPLASLGLSGNTKAFIGFLILFGVLGFLSMKGIDDKNLVLILMAIISLLGYLNLLNIDFIDGTNIYATFINKYAITAISIIGGIYILTRR